jgi:hypothetical protein
VADALGLRTVALRQGLAGPPRRDRQVPRLRRHRAHDARHSRLAHVWDREQVTVYGIHHAAKALRDIEKTVKRWGDQGGGRGLLVWARDGDERQRRQKERVEAMRAEREAQAGANPDNAEAAGT